MHQAEGDGCNPPTQGIGPQHHLLHNVQEDQESPISCNYSENDQKANFPDTPTSHRFLHSLGGKPTNYYRIAYRGVVGLLKEPHAKSAKNGAYISYGEIIASSHVIEIQRPLEGIDNPNLPTQINEGKQRQYTSSQIQSGCDTLTTTASSTTSSLPLAPQQFYNLAYNHVPRTRGDRLIRVDEVLTGGYAVDAHATAHTSSTNDCANFSCAEKSSTENQESTSGKHYGYLFQTQNGVTIAEVIPTPPLLCQPGTFFYKVTSSSPLPIITGPCADAPVTRSVALPGTVHEISLRMGSLMLDSLDSNGLENGIIYLRLSHRKGWIADRRHVITSQERQGAIIQDRYQCNEIVMKDISEYIDVTNFGMRDDESIDATSITSVSFTTPANVIRLRRTIGRNRNCRRGREPARDSRSGMIVQQKTKMKQPQAQTKKLHQKNPSGSEAFSPFSDVSLLSDVPSLNKSDIIEDGGLRRENPPKNPSAHTDTNVRVERMLVSMDEPQSIINVKKSVSDIFLMRVMAPHGLKILDAPHFQVNNLIRGKQVNMSSSQGSSQYNHSSVCSWEFDATGKSRVLSRGTLFEASKRVERAGMYTPGSFLIKLADCTGWAIVPRQEELSLQYKALRNSVKSDEVIIKAHEEVGNAIILHRNETPVHTNKDGRKWVRICQQTGVLVSCAPLSEDESISGTFPKSFSGTKTGLRGLHELNNRESNQIHDSENASCTGSVFFDVFRPTISDKGKPPTSIPKATHQIDLLIACGKCVEIEPSEETQYARDRQFVRLRGGGWIPRMIHGKQHIVDICPPSIRYGSFWFRVHTIDGIVVRTGPSRRAPVIKSDTNVPFRFECGELLRASEVLIVHGHVDMDNSQLEEEEINNYNTKPISECFAKLYRNKHSRRIHPVGKRNANYYIPLSTITAPGEWVHVESNAPGVPSINATYLEECANSPTIQRHRDGWKYKVVATSMVVIRRGPSFKADKTAIALTNGDRVLINERVTLTGENLTWLRLKDGQGWVHDIGNDNETLLVIDSEDLRITKSVPSSMLLGRFFNSDTSFL